MQINNGIGAMLLAPDADIDESQLELIYQLTTGDILIITLLALILMLLIIQAVLLALWGRDK